MGRRELLIIAGFIVVGVCVWQVTAPPAKEGEGFSFSRLWNNMRRGVQSSRVSARVVTSSTMAVPASVREVKVRGVQGTVTIQGEDRDDLAAELTVIASGPDDAEAQANARRIVLKTDALEDAIVLHPETAGLRQGASGNSGRANLVLRVPRRLAARVDGGAGVTLSDLAAIQLGTVTGDSTIRRIHGQIRGDFRGSALTIAEAGTLDLVLTRARTTITGLTGASRVEVQDGECTFTGPAGSLDLETRRSELHVREATGTVQIAGLDGRIEITHPRAEVRVDVRRTQVSVAIDRAVPMSLATTDELLELTMTAAGGPPAIQLDAVATDGQVRADEWQLAPTKSDTDSRLEHGFGSGPRVSLRTQRGDIVIKKSMT